MIRVATIKDLESIVEIYNQAIDAGFQTAFTERVTVAERLEWFHQHQEIVYPLFVFETDGNVTGWVSISPYRAGRAALRFSVEISYFVHHNYLKRGIGTQLLEHALQACAKLNYRTVIAIILDKNIPSIRLMVNSGFERWAYLPGVADFNGVICGHVYYGKTIEKPAS